MSDGIKVEHSTLIECIDGLKTITVQVGGDEITKLIASLDNVFSETNSDTANKLRSVKEKYNTVNNSLVAIARNGIDVLELAMKAYEDADTNMQAQIDASSGAGVSEGSGYGTGGVGTGVLKFYNWDDMKEAYKGALTQFLKDNKPKYSPDVKKWFDNGGSIEIQDIDGKHIWIYTSASGDSVPYIDGYVKFPDKYLNPIIKSVDIGEFTGDRGKDIDIMLAILEEDYGITEIPEGYIVHHDTENGILQLVDENIHREFTHIGGHSIYK